MNNENNNTFKVSTIEEQVIDYFNSSPIAEKEEIIVRKFKRPETRVFNKADLLSNEELDIVLQNLLEQNSIILIDETDEAITYRNNTIQCEDSEVVYSSLNDFVGRDDVQDYLNTAYGTYEAEEKALPLLEEVETEETENN
jgi:ribosome biogenesis GTPase A